MRYDYIIVGAGLFGAVSARQLTDAGYKCLVIDKRTHIAGNCYTEEKEGVQIHMYGPHIFHTNNKKVWDYVNRFAEFNNYSNRPKVSYKGKMYSFPINLMTLQQIWGISLPEEAEHVLKQDTAPYIKDHYDNLEEKALSMVGKQLYEIFFKGYTTKQWGKDPKELPASIINRIPVRTTFNDRYFNDKYEGIPVKGYTALFEKLLEGIDRELGVDYLERRAEFDLRANKKVIYTGPIDEFFDYSKGELEWRSLRFEQHTVKRSDVQGNAIINYTDVEVPHTRITEHKHFTPDIKTDNSIVTKEYPQDWDKTKEKYYPVNDDHNTEVYRAYKKMIDKQKFIFGGRLAEYKYYDMHQVIASALHATKKEIG